MREGMPPPDRNSRRIPVPRERVTQAATPASSGDGALGIRSSPRRRMVAPLRRSGESVVVRRAWQRPCAPSARLAGSGGKPGRVSSQKKGTSCVFPIKTAIAGDIHGDGADKSCRAITTLARSGLVSRTWIFLVPRRTMWRRGSISAALGVRCRLKYPSLPAREGPDSRPARVGVRASDAKTPRVGVGALRASARAATFTASATTLYWTPSLPRAPRRH